MKGKAKCGFEYDVDPDILVSWEALEIRVKIEKGDNSAAVDGYRFLLGDEQFDRLLDFLRKKTKKRFVKQEDIYDVFTDIWEAASEDEEETKN